jgi:hypothetical protein
MSDDQLGNLDIAEVNLACAAGLPGGPTEPQARECIDRLDHYARCTRIYTDRHLPDFRANPSVWGGSEALFRVLRMVAMLREMYGVRYNPGKIPDEAPFGAADTFIHGALLGDGGTCASLPVVYAAVGRRLGYPLRLVSARRHLFARWDEPHGERFNFEVTAEGTSTPPDEHYLEGRFAASPEVASQYCWLQSKKPRMEVSSFLMERSLRWADTGNYKEGVHAVAWSSVMAPQNKLPQVCLLTMLDRWLACLRAAAPPNFPAISVEFPPRRYPAPIPQSVEQRMIFCEVVEKCLNHPAHQQWWEELRWARDWRPPYVPTTIQLKVLR